MTVEEIRREFPHIATTTYLNHAATSPLSRRVTQAIDTFLEQRQRTCIDNYVQFQPVIHETKQRLADLIGVQAHSIEFAQNTSDALHLLASSLPWNPGDRIAIPACEFPANVYPFLNLERRGVKVDFIAHRDGTFTLDDVAAALTPRTRLLSLSWVQFLSGFRAPLAEIGALCRDRGILLSVDAIQGMGALRLDAPACGIDFLACGVQKWMMATQGNAFLYVADHLLDRMDPPAGWLHGPVDWDNFLDYRLAFWPDARRFRIGTYNNIGIAALSGALGIYLQAGPDLCEQRILSLARRLSEGLHHLGLQRFGTDDTAHASGILTVRHPDASALFQRLEAAGVQISLRQGMLRFSPHFYNTEDEIDHTLEVISIALQADRPTMSLGKTT